MNNEPLPVDLTVTPEGVSRIPKMLELSLTGKCNLKCGYCFYSDSMESKKDLPSERWLSFFKEIGQLGVQRVCLSGGEVFTRPDLFALIDGVIENRMRYKILTNGTLITEETVEALKHGKRKVRLDSIQVSIDGSNAKIHNLSRPPDSFDRAVAALRLLKEAGFPVTVRVTLNHHNITDLEAIAKLLIEDIGLPGFSTNEAEVMGSARCSGQKIVLSEKERTIAMEVLLQLDRKYRGGIAAAAGPLSRAKAFREIEEMISKGESQKPGMGFLCSCGGVFSQMAVLHDGTMVPCNMIPTLVMGVIGMHPLHEVWLNSPVINAVRRRRDVPLSSLPECNGCSYTGFCAGGCPAAVMAKTGRLIGIDPLICYREYQKEVNMA